MSKQERKEILEMLKEGTITFEQAEKLLDAIEEKQEVGHVEVVSKPGSRKMLKILVSTNDGDNVKVQIPVEFAKFAKKGTSNLNLEEFDIDIDSVIQMIEDGALGEIVDIKTAKGEIVKIVVE
jgi:hypothetical protein